MFPIFSQKVLSIITLYFGIGVVSTIFFISLWFRRRIVKLLGLNFGLGVVSMIETWCSWYWCCLDWLLPHIVHPCSMVRTDSFVQQSINYNVAFNVAFVQVY